MPRLSRRHLIASALAAAAPKGRAAPDEPPKPLLCVFSKHLQFLGYAELGHTLAGLGAAGVDLTVRPGGHVLPENVERDLPRAVEALRGAGVEVPMITTSLTSPADPAARPTLYTAARLGIPYFKFGYWRYEDLNRLDERLDEVKREAEGLAAIAKHAEIEGGFHNHSGRFVGAALWDHWRALRDAGPRWTGFYFDPCHATIEGGLAGWEIGFHRLAPRIKMVAVKDFFWEQRGGSWRVRMCPLGEGMVDYPAFFRKLAASGFRGPVSLHVEYEIEAGSEAARREKTLAAIDRDLGTLKKLFSEAFG